MTKSQNVLWLDIPMDDVMTSTAFQHAADVRAKLSHRLLVSRAGELLFKELRQRCQKLHPDHDVVSRIIIILYDQKVFEADDIAAAFQLIHQLEFSGYFLHTAFEQIGHADLIIALISKIRNLRR